MKNALHESLRLTLATSFLLAACGGSSTPPPDVPSESPSASAAASAAAPPEGSSPPAVADKAKEGAAPAPAALAAAKSSRAARDILELKDTVFFLAFGESDPGKEAETTCAKSAGKNPKMMTACMAKALQRMDDEGHRFEQDKDGTQWWLVIHRKGNALTTVHKIRFTYGAETEKSIVIKPEGKDVGSKPWKSPPAEVKFDVPTEYRIVLRDPKYGKLVYEAKSGIGGSK